VRFSGVAERCAVELGSGLFDGPETLERIRVNGRVYDEVADSGLPGVMVALKWPAGAAGFGGAAPVVTDSVGEYRMQVPFDSPVFCMADTYFVGVVIPEGFGPSAERVPYVQCTGGVQVVDIPLRRQP